jgi:hypothetical protein
MTTRGLLAGVAAIAVAAFLTGAPAPILTQPATAQVAVDKDDIGGVVRGPNGPEAGVWVIAETTDLPTKYAKIAVTDDQGRYLIPDLPEAKYKVWVRGYGLVDSSKVDSEPGRTLDLTAVPAPDAKAAAQYYPPIYWYSMIRIPAKNEFPLGPVKTQPEWVNVIKSSGCMSCHALGSPGTRTIPKTISDVSKDSVEAWQRRLMVGQAQTQMMNGISRLETQRALKMFADWTDRVAAGELPFDKPSRPQGVERNIVLTTWDWSTPTGYMHDLISTDRRNPTINANGKLYGAPEESTDFLPVLDPNSHTATQVEHPVRDPKTPSSKNNPMAPSPFWGPEPIWDSKTSIHNQMMDEKGRVWMAARIRHPNNPDYCKKGGEHPSAKVFPLERSGRHLSMYDQATGRFTLISTCFPTHHVIFAEDANNTLWVSSGVTGPGAVGWLNRKMYEETGDEMKAQGWSPFVLDTNGNGKRDAFIEPNQPADPTKDTRVAANLYGVAVNPRDGSIWGTQLGYPGRIVRVAPGPDPTHTALTEVYEVPFPGYGPRGGDIGRDGIYWASLASGHLGRFDRSKCKVLNGPTATGKHCPEGWTLYKFPGPQFRDVQDEGSVEASYFTWVDQFNTLGLGANVPIATGNMSDGYHALVDGKFVTIRVPYRMGFFAKWAEGRIDDPNAGWKGRGLWATSSDRTVFHNEGGTKNRPQVVRFQLRPDPLAK